MFIKPNLGRIDRLVRFAIGAILIAAPYVLSDAVPWEVPVARGGFPIVGTVLVLTAFFGVARSIACSVPARAG